MGIDRVTVIAAKNTAKFSASSRLSIPKAIRTAHGWRAGQVFAFIPRASAVLLMQVPPLEELAGIARGANPNDYRDRTNRDL